MKRLVNYEPLKKFVEEFPYIKLIDSEYVFVDLPIVAVDFGKSYTNPVLYGVPNSVPVVFEDYELKEVLGKVKLFHFKENNGRLVEVSPEEATVNARLPLDTKVDELIYKDGQIIWAKPIKKESE